MPPEQREKWMEEAIALAMLAAEKDEAPIGALLIHDGKILGRGRNRREETQRTAAHAEFEALEQFHAAYQSWRVPVGTTLIATLEPCVMCTGALLWSRVTTIYYGCADPKNAGLNFLLPTIEAGRFDHKFAEVVGGIRQEECAELLKAFFKKKRADSTKVLL